MAKKKILLVDADLRSARVLEVSLRKADYNVTCAHDGTTALEMIEHQVPDLIIADTKLPKLDGYGLAKRLKERSDWASVPIIFLTAQRSVEDRIRGLELGVEDYLAKPVFVRELLARVSVVLARRAQQSLAEQHASSSAAQPRVAGSIHDMTVVDLLQTFEVSRRSGTITFTSALGTAYVWFTAGRVIDAELGTLRGEEALYRLLVWSAADFVIDFEPVDREEFIGEPTAVLVMEGMRRADEWGRVVEQLPPLDSVYEVDHEKLRHRLTEIPDELNGILRLLDGQRGLQAVIDESPFEDLSTATTLSKLYFEGLIVPAVSGSMHPPAVSPAASVPPPAVSPAPPRAVSEQPPKVSQSVRPRAPETEAIRGAWDKGRTLRPPVTSPPQAGDALASELRLVPAAPAPVFSETDQVTQPISFADDPPRATGSSPGLLRGDSIVVLGQLEPSEEPPPSSGLPERESRPTDRPARVVDADDDASPAARSASSDTSGSVPPIGPASERMVRLKEIVFAKPATDRFSDDASVIVPRVGSQHDGDDAPDARFSSQGASPASVEDDASAMPRAKRVSGRTLTVWVIGVTLAFAAVALYARYTYRGEHDTAEGLGLPLRDAAAATTLPPEGDPATSGGVGATTPVVAATQVVDAAMAADANVPRGTTAPASPGISGAGTGVAETPGAGPEQTLTQQAQSALEKEGGRHAVRASELAWRATKNDPSNAEAWLTLGAAYQTLGNRVRAQQAYRTCATKATGPRVAECRALAGMPPE